MVMKQLIPEVFIDYDPYGGGFNLKPGLPSYTPPPTDTSIYKGEEIPEIITRAQPLIEPKVEPKVQPKPTLQPGILDFKTYDLDKPGGLVNQKNIPMPKMGPFTPATTPSKSKNQQLGLMLYALGGALRGDKNFVEKTMQLKDIQDSKKREKEMKDNWKNALNKIKKEGNISPTLISLAEIVGPEQGARLVAAGIPEEKEKEEKKTAAIINLEAYNQIKAAGNPEDIAIAERVLIGTRQNKPVEQMKKELIASLLKQTDPLGDPISEEEINNRLQLFDTLVGETPTTPINTEGSPTQIEGYNVVEVK